MNNLKLLVIIIHIFTISLSQSSYSMEDVNSSSATFGIEVGQSYFEETVIIHYFGSFTWGTCTARFGQLNDINDNLKSLGHQVELIGISKSSWINGLSNWINQGTAPICVDSSPYPIWDDWNANQRDLFITDKIGNIIFSENITSGIPSNINEVILSSLSLLDASNEATVFSLKQNFPNPFNPTTSLRYDLSEDGLVNITVYDMMGRVVKTLINSSQTAGFKSVQWDATNNLGQPVSAGMYIYTIQAGEFRQSKKMVLLK